MNALELLRFCATPALLWLWLCWHLHDEWTLSAQYNYGWAVPVLAALLFYRRWQERPARPEQSAGAKCVLRCFLLLLLLPLRLVGEANPDWRALSWALAAVVVALSLFTIRDLGGSNWLRHFAVPICFMLVAVPWPVQFENWAVHGLTGTVAAAAVEIAGWLGIGAYRLGNVIQLANGFVGVDEACSGVRTLQVAIMISVFLGELLVLRTGRRFLLVTLGCMWVFACNVVRATTLVAIAARDGISSLERWHDLIGTVVLVGGIFGISAAAFWLTQPQERLIPDAEERGVRHSSSLGKSLATLAWLLVIFAATEVWYRVHERHLVRQPGWALQLPEIFGARPLPIAKSTAEILRYNTATSVVWQGEGAAQWWAFFARWEPKRAALQLVRSHSPEVCLPAVGRTFRRDLPSFIADRGSLHLSFAASEFWQDRQPLFVFVCIQADKTVGAGATIERAEFNVQSRLRAAWHGERNFGQRLLELAVTGVPDYAAAREATLRAVGQIIQPVATD